MLHEAIPFFHWELIVGTAEGSDDVILCSAPGALSIVCAMVVGGNILDGLHSAAQVSVKFMRGLIVEAHDVDAFAKLRVEGDCSCVSLDIFTLGTILHEFEVDVAAPDGQEDILVAALRDVGEATCGVGMADAGGGDDFGEYVLVLFFSVGNIVIRRF